jgi:hypothetical protein
MFRRRTLFVVGAGASAEFGLPSGRELAARISQKVDIRYDMFENRHVGAGDIQMFMRLTKQQHENVREFQKAGWLIRDGIQLARSIDDFLDLHKSNPFAVTYGKAAIVNCVLEVERASSLFFGKESFAPAKIANTWLVKLIQMLGPGYPVENAREIFERISFVIFNYDRCVEFFLLNALQKLYGIGTQEAEDIVAALSIDHPYAVIDPTVEFGSAQADYAKLAGGIKTYTEQIGDADVLRTLSNKIPDAEHVVFLGFAYHDQNMNLLTPPKPIPDLRRIFGTAFGMSDSDIDVVGHQIDEWFERRDKRAYRSTMIRLENKLKCADLFDHYAKSLTGG